MVLIICSCLRCDTACAQADKAAADPEQKASANKKLGAAYRRLAGLEATYEKRLRRMCDAVACYATAAVFGVSSKPLDW